MDTNKNSPFYRNVVEQVVKSETVPIRFENFANLVVSELEGGAPVLSTSKSWDLGRDGVGYGSAKGLFVLTSLRDDLDAKVFSDFERIQETTRYLKTMYFCSSQPLSEHKREQLRHQLADETDHAYEIDVLGASQIAELSIKYGDIAERFYNAEIQDVLKVLTAAPSDTSQENGFRLAILAAASEDSDAIRKEVYRTRLLDALRDGQGRTPAIVSKAISEALQLGRNIPTSTLAPHLDELTAEKLISYNGIAYQITAKGSEEIAQREKEGVGRLLELKGEIRTALEQGLGETIQIDHFNQIWKVFEAGISYYFASRGESLVAEVRRVFGEKIESNAVGTPHESLSFLDDLARSVGATSTNPDRRQDLEQAVKDIFSDRDGPAANWLIRISANFMCACAMGIEASTSRAMSQLFSKTRLLLDTDVILSLLGSGEPEHEGVATLVDRWRKLGGIVFAAR